MVTRTRFGCRAGGAAWEDPPEPSHSTNAPPLIILLLNELHISMPSQKTEITYEIELHRTQFEARQPDHFRQVPMSVAPIQGYRGHGSPCARGVAFPLVVRQIIQRQRAEPLAFDHDLRGGIC